MQTTPCWPCTEVSNAEHNNLKNYMCLLFLDLPRLPSITLTSSLHKLIQLQLQSSLLIISISVVFPQPLFSLFFYFVPSLPFPFLCTDLVLLNQYKYASHVPASLILDIKVVSVLLSISHPQFSPWRVIQTSWDHIKLNNSLKRLQHLMPHIFLAFFCRIKKLIQEYREKPCKS